MAPHARAAAAETASTSAHHCHLGSRRSHRNGRQSIVLAATRSIGIATRGTRQQHAAMFEFILTLIVAVFIMIFMMAIGVAITMPFHGALVRLRANYNPRGVGLEAAAESGTMENRVGPTLTTVFATLQRTKRIEGWQGLYKGALPSLVFTTLVSIASVIFVGSSATRGPKGSYTVPDADGVRMTLFTLVMTTITLPMTIIINRSIITPFALPSKPMPALKLILTPVELAKPWTLYLTPGLLLVTFAQACYVTLFARTVRRVLLGPGESADIAAASPGIFLVFLIFQFASAGILTPFEVIATRLSIQPNVGASATGAGYSLAANAVDENGDQPKYAGQDEDVIGLRPIEEPYEGAVDCARKIWQEEGRESLWRGWIWTALGNVLGSFM